MRNAKFAAMMMVNEGDADGLVTGHTRSYSSVVKLCYNWWIKAAGASIIATTWMMTARGPMFYQIPQSILINAK
jgi:malate dehydrogenase (oxaloacetate-decarboxylating)(NADP+)